MTARFDFDRTALPDLLVIRRKPMGDNRGFLERMYCESEMREAGVSRSIRQINRTVTRARGTVRGLHFQRRPMAETKIVSCIRGRVFDVAVDLRAGSPTYLAWFGIELSADNGLSMLIPEGFAHGLQTLEDDCEMLYFHTADYAAAAEGGLNAMDSRIGIAWPVPCTEISDKDRSLPTVEEGFEGFLS